LTDLKKVIDIYIILGVLVLALTIGLNARHALNDYGVKDNKLHVEVLAQTSTTGGDGSGSSSSGGGTSTTEKKYHSRTDTEQAKTTKSCDGVKHTTTAEPGYARSCSGTGSLDCQNQWYSTGQATTTTSDHTGYNCIFY
jgi:hypothetical protein